MLCKDCVYKAVKEKDHYFLISFYSNSSSFGCGYSGSYGGLCRYEFIFFKAQGGELSGCIGHSAVSAILFLSKQTEMGMD